MYESDVLSLGKAARMAGLSMGAFLDKLGALGIPAVRYASKELSRELTALRKHDRHRRRTSHRVRPDRPSRNTA
jgi:predicted HTH domain antitoxin